MPTQPTTKPSQEAPTLGLFLACFCGEPRTVMDVAAITDWPHFMSDDLETLAGGLVAEGYLEAVPPVTAHGPRLRCTPLGQRTSREVLSMVLASETSLHHPSVREVLAWIAEEAGTETFGAAPDARLGALQDGKAPARLAFEPDLVYVPAGAFAMGSSDREVELLVRRYEWAQELAPEGYFDYERPQQEITLPAYWIGRCPVTNEQFAPFVRDTGAEPPADWSGRLPPTDRLTHPVNGVQWHSAQAYVQWLSQQSQRPYRLPTEAEWEKAARGTDRRLWPWGNELPDARHCNFGSYARGTTPVGLYSPAGDSPYGCVDMAGNVNEWCQTLYKLYPYHPADGREDVQVSGTRVLRGGAFYMAHWQVRCAFRFQLFPSDRYRYSGLRVVMA